MDQARLSSFLGWINSVDREVGEIAGVSLGDIPDALDLYPRFVNQMDPREMAVEILTDAGFDVEEDQ